MSIKKEEIQEMLEQAVYQQLFCTDAGNRIMGKNPEYTMQFSGVEELLNNFIDELRQNIPLILDFKIEEFLHVFEERFGVNLDKTLTRIKVNFEGMGGEDFVRQQETMMVYMVLTKMNEALREYGYEKWGRQRIVVQYEEITGKKFTEKIQTKLNDLAALNNRPISLLYNLSFLTLLAVSYDEKNFSKTAKRLSTMKVNKIIRNQLMDE